MTGPGWPNERGWLAIMAWATFVYVISLVAFVRGLDDSQLFTALASGVAGAVFRDVVGMWTSSTKAGSELASKAMDTLQSQSTTSATGKPDDPVHTVDDATRKVSPEKPDVELKPGETARAVD